MKRWIHANSRINASKFPDQTTRNSTAKRDLVKHDREKVGFVRECQDEVNKAIQDSYAKNGDGYFNNALVTKISNIKNKFIEEAIDEDLMSEEEFEEIFDLLDIVDSINKK